MAVWRDDDPPMRLGRPRESVLWRRVYRLRLLLDRSQDADRRSRISSALSQAIAEIESEMTLNDQI